MSNRDIARRLLRLEADRHGDVVRYIISDRLLSDAEWQSEMDGRYSDRKNEPAPVLTIKEWSERFCRRSPG